MWRCGYKLANALLLTDAQNTQNWNIQIGVTPFAEGLNLAGLREGEWEAFSHMAPRALSFKHLMEYLYPLKIAEDREFLARGGRGW